MFISPLFHSQLLISTPISTINPATNAFFVLCTVALLFVPLLEYCKSITTVNLKHYLEETTKNVFHNI